MAIHESRHCINEGIQTWYIRSDRANEAFRDIVERMFEGKIGIISNVSQSYVPENHEDGGYWSTTVYYWEAI